ncbi:MAG: serine/threonine protein kinase [Nocardioides sp.]|nr:serine/threonine protein kinase [Nocardioides sp.]
MIAGRYTLERVIGRGGSGSVHLAHDHVLGRHVAMKRIGMMPGTDAHDLARAEREARISAGLDHPHVVTVFDLVAEDDAHWLVMEYVEGRTLAQLVRDEGPLPPARAASLVGQVADALAEAHGRGIVHRDVKPSNVLVGAGDDAKLGDFGIARASTDATLTQTGLVTGSPAYLAPEVASGASATPASDVWSLGATLFHAVTGSPPYDVGDNLIGALYRIVHEDPPRLPDGHPLAGLVEATMVKDPAARWTAAQVRDELVRVQHGEAGSTPPPPLPLAVPASPPAPATTTTLPSAPTTRAEPARRRGGAWLPWVAVLVVAGLVVAIAVLLSPGDGRREPDADRPRGGQGATDAGSPAPAHSAQAMDAFVASYLTAVIEDPESAFAMLTPDFQQASGGYDGYLSWWGTVQSASPRNIESDPEDLTVEYTVDYVLESGRRSTEDVGLQLVREGGGYLIAGED